MKNKWVFILLGGLLLIIIGGLVIYQEVFESRIERETYEFLRKKGYNRNDIDDIDVKQNKMFSYKECRVFVEFELVDDVIFVFKYHNNNFMIQGVRGEHYLLTESEIQQYETMFDNGELSYSSFNKHKSNTGKATDTQVSDVNRVLSLKENTLSRTGATFILANNTDKVIGYGEEYWLEIKQNGNWHKIDADLNFNMLYYELYPGISEEFKINWSYGYGSLSNGQYRLIKHIDDLGYVSAEFIIK